MRGLAALLETSVHRGASDLHLSAGLPPMLRMDGEIHRVGHEELSDADVLALLADVMSEQQQTDYAAELEADFSFEVPGLARFRANVFQQQRGTGAVLRTIPSRIPTMEALGMGKVFRRIAEQDRGLVVVTGPTGSGKSTTLAAMIDHINSSAQAHILTIEDPIEFVHTSKRCLVNQREVHRDTRGFAEALRSALREDPDIILMGELRELETIRLALTAAETGHLVLATLHTTCATKTIDRIIDVFPASEKSMVRSMLSESLQAVISQRLLKKVGGGRVACHEILICNAAIRNLIREDRIAQMYSAMQTGAGLGMKTFDQRLLELAEAGVVSHDIARSKSRTSGPFSASGVDSFGSG